MKPQLWSYVFFVSACVSVAVPATAQHAAEVISYNAGTTPEAGYTIPSAALGEPERFTGEGMFPATVTPFNPPWLDSEIVSIGEGGHLTLRLSNFVLTQTPGPHLGVFTNAGIADENYPNGQAGSPLFPFGVDDAIVEVSEDGIGWQSLGNRTFDIPTNGYADVTDPYAVVPGDVPSDFLKPFTGTLADFDSLQHAPDILALFDGSGGGTWLDLSGSGLDKVGYVRFTVLDDDDDTTSLNFELDGVAIARGAIGAQVPEPGVVAWGVAGCVVALIGRRRFAFLRGR